MRMKPSRLRHLLSDARPSYGASNSANNALPFNAFYRHDLLKPLRQGSQRDEWVDTDGAPNDAENIQKNAYNGITI